VTPPTLRRYAAPVAAALTVAVLGLAAPADATHDFRLTNPEQEQGWPDARW
jgi:hypothetical protein